ncbi:MAG: selenocysteine-specific translation elongation factor, partial [Candidatus Zixiibacteriota bacterium]
MITIGLAGHIDPGKSALVKRLTGTDPDRLPEEQARGMTIDLGFAHWNSSSDIDGGTNAGVPDVSFVDVPGHERFVRNMIAGAGGIEAALLVVAADDGWMPQSQEHFDIMSLLGLDRGIIAVTKTDLVEPEWVETVIDDIKTRVGGSFLETAPLVPVSSTTGDGFDQLRSNLRELSTTYTAHHDIGKPRLFADRAFILPGMGRVLTGSARGGGFAVGDEVVVYPALATGKVRTLHRHDRQVGSVAAGQRAALSFTGIDSKALARGSVVTKPEFCAEAGEGKFLIARVRVLPDCSVRLSTRRKLSLFLGTSEVSCELRAAGESHLSPGTDSLVALRCSSKPLCFAGDRFILRLPTPQITVGGGVILGWRERVQTREQLEAFREFATEEALTPRGALAVWSSDDAPNFERRLRQAGLTVRHELVPALGE